MKWLRYMTMVLALAAIGACGGGDDPEDEPDVRIDLLDVTPSVELLGDGSTADITIKANCDWTITKDDAWLSVTPSSGKGTESVRITAGKNTSGDQRIAVLTVKGGTAPTKRITVTQTKSSDSDPSGPTEPTNPTDPDNPDTQKEPEAGDNLPPS